MQRKVIYIAEDGTRFDSKDGCLNYEALSDKCKRIMSSLFYDKKELDNGNALRHDNDVVKSCFGHFMDLCSIIFLCKDGRHFHEASYFGYDYDNGEPRFQADGLTVDNRDIWLWCERKDLFYKTNLAELQKQTE